jgi:hypothetical protein
MPFHWPRLSRHLNTFRYAILGCAMREQIVQNDDNFGEESTEGLERVKFSCLP